MSQPHHPYEMTLPVDTPDWTLDAECLNHDPDLFFPSDPSNDRYANFRDAAEVCERCPVIAQCARRALDGREVHGIWAGVNMSGRGAARVDRYERLTALAKQVA
ncbi:WhiB family transcriptional regulator [Rhodococcoides corynebacterioides]|uniref:WhiB family transcriptional regulator n=1 Tax=Rhodococcoides corynebacterioides TaxID=53972 RepID=UPI003F7D7CAC